MNLRTLLLSSVSLLAAACGGAAVDGPSADGSEEEALSMRMLPDVAAIEFETVTPGAGQMNGRPSKHTFTIGADAKVKKIVRGLKRRTEADAIPLCHPGSTRTSMKFFNAKGEQVATGGYTCRMGSVERADGTTIPIILRSDEVSQALDAPLVPKDALWGIDKIDIKKLQRVGDAPTGIAHVDKAEGIDKVLAAMNIEQSIDTDYSGTRCLPTHVLTFFRKASQVAYSAYVCHLASPIPQELTSHFTMLSLDEGEDADPVISGGIKINPRAIEDVYADELRGAR